MLWHKNKNRKPGTYIFEATNTGIDREAGLAVANTDNDATGEHIKEGYLAHTIKKGETAQSQAVTLEAGKYECLCPLNLAPKHTITVSE